MKRALGHLAGSAVVVTVLVWRVGTGPFLHGLRAVDGGVLAAAAGLALVTTVACAWRWKVIANGLGAELGLPAAVAAYYRSIFLNVALPGGIVGDVHRAVGHGRGVSDVGRAVRAVAWERGAGQVVQVGLTIAVLLALPSPVRSSMPPVAAALAVAALVVVVVARRPAWARARSVAAVTLASAVVVAGHAATFVIAAQAAGTTASLERMLPLALLAMLVMALPSIGGWGPREGAVAWVFGLAGLGAQQGVATSVVYGVMVLAASLPGAAVLVVSWSSGLRPATPADA